MNQKKAKALRRACAGMPRMSQRVLTADCMRTLKHKVTGEIKRAPIKHPAGVIIPVNHYRNAKRRYTGDVQQAVRRAAAHAMMCETLDIYKVGRR